MKRLIILALTCASYYLHAQEVEPIVTDRPTQSAASAVVPKGSVLIEYGFVNEKAGEYRLVLVLQEDEGHEVDREYCEVDIKCLDEIERLIGDVKKFVNQTSS